MEITRRKPSKYIGTHGTSMEQVQIYDNGAALDRWRYKRSIILCGTVRRKKATTLQDKVFTLECSENPIECSI